MASAIVVVQGVVCVCSGFRWCWFDVGACYCNSIETLARQAEAEAEAAAAAAAAAEAAAEAAAAAAAAAEAAAEA